MKRDRTPPRAPTHRQPLSARRFGDLRFDPATHRAGPLRLATPAEELGAAAALEARLERASRLGHRVGRAEIGPPPGEDAERLSPVILRGRRAEPSVQRARENLDFASFWVGDAEPQTIDEKALERLPQNDFDGLKDLWSKLKANSTAGRLSITKMDENKKEHNNFQKMVLAKLGTLLARKQGRQLLQGLAAGGHEVMIAPLADAAEGAHALPENRRETERDLKSGKAGKGSKVFVYVDPNLSDDTVKAFDADFEELANPGFLVLGHELIHAKHMVEGTTAPKGEKPLIDPEYHELEEEETIASGKISENALRQEHGLKARFGHEGKETGFPNLVRIPADLNTLEKLAKASGVEEAKILQANPRLQVRALQQNPEWAAQVLAKDSKSLAAAFQGKEGLLDPADEQQRKHFAKELGAAMKPAELFSQATLTKKTGEVVSEEGDVLNALESNEELSAKVANLFEETLQTTLSSAPELAPLLLANSATLLDELFKSVKPSELIKSAPHAVADLLLGVDLEGTLAGANIGPLEILAQVPRAGAQIKVRGELTVPGATTHRLTRGEAKSGKVLEAVAKEVGRDAKALATANPAVIWDKAEPGTWLLVPPASS